MLGKINKEQKEKNEKYLAEIMADIGAKGIEKMIQPENIKVGDVLYYKGKAVEVKESDIKEIKQGPLPSKITVFGSSFPNFQRFVF